jgi:hypothetical protein
MPKVTQDKILNASLDVVKSMSKEIRWLKKQVRDLLEVADNCHYAYARGDWDILEAADRGAVRLLKRHKQFNKEYDE